MFRIFNGVNCSSGVLTSNGITFFEGNLTIEKQVPGGVYGWRDMPPVIFFMLPVFLKDLTIFLHFSFQAPCLSFVTERKQAGFPR